MLNMMVMEESVGKDMCDPAEGRVIGRAFQAGKHMHICPGNVKSQSVGFQETSWVLIFPF